MMEVDRLDDIEQRLIATGWATKPKDPFGGMDADEIAMARKLLERPAPPPAPTVQWYWRTNSLGREWRIGKGRLLRCRGFSEASLNSELRRLKADGYVIERGTDVQAVVA